ncbi:MAG TPA: helix-turn-helix transcriptional regulator [Actinomycetota bacterium]|nr:helix-turn-helix transcriptional regulator [Actinomycetota bacterium]
MDPGRLLRSARRRAGLTQRRLARRLGVPQSHVAKIESAAVVPTVATLDRFLAACGEGLEALPRPGRGIDRTGFRDLLKLSPRQRLDRAAAEARSLVALVGGGR